jgi:hypothetical protein
MNQQLCADCEIDFRWRDAQMMIHRKCAKRFDLLLDFPMGLHISANISKDSYFSGMIYHLKRTIRYYCGSACPAWWIARLGVSGVFNSAVPRYQLDIFFLR